MSFSSPTDPAERFTERAALYERYRPDYPDAVIDFLKKTFGLTPAWRVADIGSGTGKLTALLLRAGCHVYAVEPNAQMRAVAETLFAGQASFVSVDGRAEQTGLPDGSIDLVMAGQAFHWFDVARFRQEALRILRTMPAGRTPGGVVMLIWNDRRKSTDFGRKYEALIREIAPNYHQARHREQDLSDIRHFFGHEIFEQATFDNHLTLDYESMVGLILSSSQVPLDLTETPMIRERLAALFERHQVEGRVTMEYDTHLFCGRPA